MFSKCYLSQIYSVAVKTDCDNTKDSELKFEETHMFSWDVDTELRFSLPGNSCPNLNLELLNFTKCNTDQKDSQLPIYANEENVTGVLVLEKLKLGFHPCAK